MKVILSIERDGQITHRKIDYKKPRYSVIKEEYLAITGSISQAVCLDQMISWFESKNKAIEMLKNELQSHEINIEDLRWIYKSSTDLANDTLLSQKQCKDALKSLVSKGFLVKRNNPDIKWDKTFQYIINVEKLIDALISAGFEIIALTSGLEQKDPLMKQDVPLIGQKVPSMEGKVPAIPSPTTSSTPSSRTSRERETPKSSLETLDLPETHTILQGKFPDLNIPAEIEAMKDWLLSKGQTRKDYMAFARIWLRKSEKEREKVSPQKEKEKDMFEILNEKYKDYPYLTAEMLGIK